MGAGMMVPEGEIEDLAVSICQKLQEDLPQVGSYFFNN